MDAVTALDVVIARRGSELLLEVIPKLMSEACFGMESLRPSSGWRKPQWSTFWGVGTQWLPVEPKRPREWWTLGEPWGLSYAELLFRESDLNASRDDEPLFAAGWTFKDPSDETRTALLAWAPGSPAGTEVAVSDEGGLVRVAARKYLASLVLDGPTFPEQVSTLSAWAENAIIAIARMRPPARVP